MPRASFIPPSLSPRAKNQKAEVGTRPSICLCVTLDINAANFPSFLHTFSLGVTDGRPFTRLYESRYLSYDHTSSCLCLSTYLYIFKTEKCGKAKIGK